MARKNDYKSATAEVGAWSDLSPEAAESLPGRTIARVLAHDYSVTLVFADGNQLMISAGGDCPLWVEFERAAPQSKR